jgi:hypothetical protein
MYQQDLTLKILRTNANQIQEIGGIPNKIVILMLHGRQTKVLARKGF